MIVAIQIISKVLHSSDISIIENNALTTDYFTGFEQEYEFIQNHHRTYGNVPDKATFLEAFPNFELVEVTESDKYLIDKINEEYLYKLSVPALQKYAEMLKTDSNAATEYITSALANLQPPTLSGGVDIVSQAQERYTQFEERKAHQEDWFFESGFKELDEITHGVQREEELFVIVARTNQGKSWVLEKIATHIWGTGFNVGYFSPEMSANSIGFRFDTLYSHYGNKSLMWGNDDIQADEYKAYIDKLATNNHKFMVATPKDFGNQLTVTKLKNWIRQYQLDLVAIDGITYMTDERGKRNDNKTTSLTNISEDLMALSVEMKVPIIIVVQANRSGVVGEDDGTPELESIRDSDGIAHNASKVISIRQKKDGILEMGIKKQRFGAVGGKLDYQWDIDTGEFVFVPNNDDAEPREKTKQRVDKTKKTYDAKKDVF